MHQVDQRPLARSSPRPLDSVATADEVDANNRRVADSGTRSWLQVEDPVEGDERTPLSATIRRITPLMPLVGVTRVAEVTHLDRNGIPNFAAVRPREPRGGISYYSGKGSSRARARVGAMMEAIERFSGERCDLPVVVASYAQLGRDAPAVDPAALVVPRVRAVGPESVFEWVVGHDLLADRPTYVPLEAVVSPYRSRIGRAHLYTSSNGLAAGNTRVEALRSALCEVNERDAMALYHAATTLRHGVARLMAASDRDASPPLRDGYPLIDPRGMPARAARVYRRLVAAGFKVYLRDITSDLGIATIECSIAETLGPRRFEAFSGYGCHPDARVALARALLEAAQSRVTSIQGGREDLPDRQGRDAAGDPDLVLGGGATLPFAAVVTHEDRNLVASTRWLLGRFRAAGFAQVVAVDLTRPEVGVPVVRVVVPGAEAWSVFHMHHKTARIGARALTRLTGRATGGEDR